MNILLSTKIAALGAILTLGSTFNATANEIINLGTLEPGVEYSWPQYATVMGEYTPSKTGPVKFIYSTTQLGLYTTPDHNEDNKISGQFSYVDAGKLISYDNLQEGTTYYVYHSFTMDAGTMVIHEGASELELTSTIPSVNPEDPEHLDKISASSTYEMVVNFNFPITIGNTFLVAPDNTRVAVSTKVESTSVGCDIAPAMMELYHDGKINEGDEVILRLLQVKDASDAENKYNGNGRCEITFKVAAKPLELVEVIGASRSAVDNEFCSYYLPGDEKSLIKFVFDGPLSTSNFGVGTIEYGARDNIEVGVYTEDVVATHDGDTAIFDFSGKRRRPIDMLPASDSSTQPDGLFISFGNLFSPDGQRAYTGSKSNPTGFPVSFMVKVLQYTVVGDFTPARGTELTFGNPMEIWVMNGDKIQYETIRFEFTQNGQPAYYDMPENEVTEEADPYSEGAMLYTFLIPELPCDEDTPVTVRMTGLICADGLDHSNDVYGDFTKASPSGVEGVAVNAADTFDVYDIAGVRVLKGADRNALSGLAKGIYLVNGKKIVIR